MTIQYQMAILSRSMEQAIVAMGAANYSAHRYNLTAHYDEGIARMKLDYAFACLDEVLMKHIGIHAYAEHYNAPGTVPFFKT